MDNDQRIAEITAECNEAKAFGAKGYMIPVVDVDYLVSLLAAKDAEIERLRNGHIAGEKQHQELCDEVGGLLETVNSLRWIPVTEGLPEVGKCVLVRQTYHAFIGDHGEYEGITVGYLHHPPDKRRMPYFYYAAVSEYGDVVRAESICPGHEFVTHWMPLPAPPEKGE